MKTLRGQFDVMFNFYDPSVHPAHHLIAGPLALNTKILQYGTVSDQLASKPLMDRLMTVLGLCFDSLQEGDRTPYNVALHEFMVDYNNRDDVRVRPKPQHKDAWQSPEALLQFAIGVAANANRNFWNVMHISISGPPCLMNLSLLQFKQITLKSMAMRRQYLLRVRHAVNLFRTTKTRNSWLPFIAALLRRR